MKTATKPKVDIKQLKKQFKHKKFEFKLNLSTGRFENLKKK